MQLADHELRELAELTTGSANSITCGSMHLQQVQDTSLKSILEKHLQCEIKSYNTKVGFLNGTSSGATQKVPDIAGPININHVSSIPLQPLMPRTNATTPDDREIATSHLLSRKMSGRDYANAAMEMSNPEIRTFCEDSFKSASHEAYEVWEWMVNKGAITLWRRHPKPA